MERYHCYHCWQEVVRLNVIWGNAICNTPAVPYWLTDNPDTEIYTPNGESIYCVLNGPEGTAHGIGYTRHTCYA